MVDTYSSGSRLLPGLPRLPITQISIGSMAIWAQIKKAGKMCLILMKNFRKLSENIRNRKSIVDTNEQLLDVVTSNVDVAWM